MLSQRPINGNNQDSVTPDPKYPNPWQDLNISCSPWLFCSLANKQNIFILDHTGAAPSFASSRIVMKTSHFLGRKLHRMSPLPRNHSSDYYDSPFRSAAYFPWPEYVTMDSSVHLDAAISNCSSLSSQGNPVFPLEQPISYTQEFKHCEYSTVEFSRWDHSQDLIFQSYNITQLKLAESLRYLLCCWVPSCIKVYQPPNSSTLLLDMTKGKSDQRGQALNIEVWKHKVQFMFPWKRARPDFSWSTMRNVKIISASSKKCAYSSRKV